MSKHLLRDYIRLALETRQARVPNQLLEPDGESDPSGEEDVNEFNAIGTGNVMGHAAPTSRKQKEEKR